MMLTAIVIGLAMTHLMQGVGRIVEDPRGSRIWWVHLVWVAHMALLSVFWWWFEYKLRLIATWTFQLYAFVLGYAFLIYLICSIQLAA
jgi:cell division protein FtsW (lipid II flippase)